MPGQLYVISGPSGAGKSRIIQLLRKRVPDLVYSISHTSRKPRKNEVDGVDYRFIERETFERMIKEGVFVEWAEVYHDLYGTSFAGLRVQTDQELDVVMDLDSTGAKNIKKHFKNSILIYVLPPSLEVLERRLRERATDNERVINTRLEKALSELKKSARYDYIVVNDDLDKVVREVESIIISERCRKSRMLPKIKEMFGLKGVKT